MQDMMKRLAFLKALLAHSDRLRELLGGDWPYFLSRLLTALRHLMRAKPDDEEVLRRVDEIIEIARASPAAVLVRALLRQTGEQAGESDDTRRAMRTEDPLSGESREFPLGPRAEGGRLSTDYAPGDGAARAEANRDDVVAAGHDLAASLPAERYVNTGFSPESDPCAIIAPTRPLSADKGYYFWLEIGAIVEGTIEEEPTRLPVDQLPPEAELRVAIYGFKDEISITPGADVGALEIQPDQSVKVTRCVESKFPIPDDEDLRSRRLVFPIRTSASQGVQRLRANIYYEQVLVQSRLVQVCVDVQPEAGAKALRSLLDYTLSHSLDSVHLGSLPPHRLSLMLNDNGDGTHGFRFFGQRDFKHDAKLDGQMLQNLIDQARGAMRRVAWGDTKTWRDQAYRYDRRPSLDGLTTDFVILAKRGYRFYAKVIKDLAGSIEKADRLTELMRKPGLVQIALRKSAAHVVPAALIYDHPFHSTLRPDRYRLCSTFRDALENETSLEASSCFQGACPSHGARDVICPSGFWGYRHALGMPVDISTAPNLPTEISYRETPNLTIGVSTDPVLSERADHEERLRQYLSAEAWHYADTRDGAMELMRTRPSELVYFYCHGGLTDDKVPYIELGKPGTWGYITSDNLHFERIRWKSPRPLVFINGCHTTAVEPEQALNLVSGFIGTAGAAGVIGSEITLFEPLATAFAQAFFGRILEDMAVGEAVRLARLALLQQGNPLGLAYIAFVQAGLHLSEEKSST